MTPDPASFEIMTNEERSRILSDAIADVKRGWDNPELLKAWKPAKAAKSKSTPKKPAGR